MLNLSPIVFVIGPDLSLEGLVRRAGLRATGFASARSFLAHPSPVGPSCLVLEFPVFDLRGLEVLQRIAVERPETPVIVVTAETDIPMTVGAMKAGAVELLLTPHADSELLSAVDSAIARSNAVFGRQADLHNLRRCYDSLSVREQEVMARVVAGDLNKQAGAALGISEITVKAHRGRAMRKMGADSLAKLVTMAMRLDLPLTPSQPTATGRSAPSYGVASLTCSASMARPLAAAR